ncbi:ankyrin repeat domain-containing protein [Streptacidiphilus neutrinimicus]|uniref:ankyrin repeat domain-containing protein n=1 Tax=Streptacidiphilus neutrinimicus TaxID=105420 RepID=UPI0005A7EEA6|nr:ankyrin repeat domain-containing protein [Streptacidiphilus neutrinimicus]
MSDQIDPEVVEFANRIFDLARGGDAATLAGYLDDGVPAELINEKGDSLLMLAAYHGNAGAVRTLLAHGADANRINDRGQTPLAGAVFKGEREIVTALLAAGADPDAGQPSARAAAEMFGRTDLLA